jgi:hypothetical protein
MTDDLSRLRGARKLVTDAVEHGSAAVERVHLATAARPFGILEKIPVVAEPARVVHTVHDATTKLVYVSIRAVNRVVGAALDVAIDVAEKPRGD